MIRKATPSDIDQLVPLVIEALRAERYPTLLVSKERIRAMATACITSAQNFAWVCEHDGALMGAVAAMAVPGFWFERSEAQVVMMYCKSPGEGMAMLRELVRWFKSRPMLKRLMCAVECDADPRILKLIKRLGMGETLPTFVMTR